MVEDELALLDKNINEFWNKFKSNVSDTSCQMVGLRDAYKDTNKALAEKLSVKLKEEERMVQMYQEYKNQICRQNKLIEEKKDNLLKLIVEVNGKRQELEGLTAKIQDLKEEYAKKKETISTAKKASEERLQRLQKSVDLYKDRLGLEIRKIYGDKLQFIFTNIDPKHPDTPFMFCVHLNEARDYEGWPSVTGAESLKDKRSLISILFENLKQSYKGYDYLNVNIIISPMSDSAPHLECLAEFQENLRKTKNFSAFLANVRKAFSTMVHN